MRDRWHKIGHSARTATFSVCRIHLERNQPRIAPFVIAQAASSRSIIVAMKVATGRVIEGKVVVDGVSLREGAVVTILTRDDEGTFELTPEEEAELLLSIAEADRGETVSAEEVLASIRPRRP